MATKKVSIFSKEANSRHEEQTILESELKGEPIPTRKVPMNITLPLAQKNKLLDYAKAQEVSASFIIKQWIDEYCN